MKASQLPERPVGLALAECGFLRSTKATNYFMLAALWLGVLTVLAGCGKSEIDQALDSDANGYICMKCDAKFYTARKDFAAVCPECKQPEIEQVVAYVCGADQSVTLGPRSRGALRCARCGASTTGQTIPRKSDLTEWGATEKSMAEVSPGPA